MSSLGPIFEAKPLIVILSGEEILIVYLMTFEDNLIQDLFRRFSSYKENRNNNSNNMKCDNANSNDVVSSRSETEIYDIDSD